jgi:hypothetical protein
MATFLKALAVILAVALFATCSAALLGLPVPAAFNAAGVFCAFVVVLTLLTFAADYRRTQPVAALRRAAMPARARSELRLAA